MKLATYAFGEGGDRPLLIAHGLYGSARNWNAIAKRLADSRRVVSVDMRNHGHSPWSDSHQYPDLADDLAGVIGDGQWDVLGHSMGGKAAMMLALRHPERVARLIVADIAPVAYTHSQIQFIHAMRGVDLSGVETRSDADRLLAETVDDAAIRAFLLQALDVKEKRWRLNLDALETEMSALVGWPDGIEAAWDGLAVFLSGGDSDYVLPEHRERIVELFPRARFAKIPGAGHWLHAEKAREFEGSVRVVLAH